MFAKKIGATTLALILTTQVLGANDYATDPSLYPEAFPILERKGYVTQYDGRNRIPLWTIEHLTKENVEKRNKRASWKDDKQVYHLHRSYNSDYKYSGFSRGHMVSDQNRDNTMELVKETHLFSNACPQDQDFNDGVWGDLEDHIYDLTVSGKYESVDVITGPLFVPFDATDGKRYQQFEVIGKSDVAVPTHFFKVVYANTTDETKTTVYIMPVTAGREGEVKEFKSNFDELERLSGLKFRRS